MRNLLSTLVLASVGLVFSTGDASAFFCRKKKKCQPAPVVTYSVPSSCCGTPSYSGSGYYGSNYSAMPSAFPTYPQSNYGNYGYNNYGYGGNYGYNNYGYGGISGYNNSGYNNYGYGTGRSMLGTAGSVGSGIMSMPGMLFNRIR